MIADDDRSTPVQQKRSISYRRIVERGGGTFDYTLNYKALNLRDSPELYRVGRGEQGVLLVEPYKSEILPHWRFSEPSLAARSARKIELLFARYKRDEDFPGMDMCRKFLQMGYTRSRRYANHKSGRKYSKTGALLPFANDAIKAESAEIFFAAWKRVEADQLYQDLKISWKEAFG